MQVVDAVLQVPGVRSQQLGGGGGGGRAHIGHKIADRNVGFVADGTHDRGHAGVNGAGHGFFVKAPQVFQRATAPGQDQRIKAARIGEFQCAHDLRGGFTALHGSRDQRQLDVRCTAAKHADDVANNRARGRADNTNALRMSGQGHLALGTEQPFSAELFFECIEGQTQRPLACGFDSIEDQLIVATAFK